MAEQRLKRISMVLKLLARSQDDSLMELQGELSKEDLYSILELLSTTPEVELELSLTEGANLGTNRIFSVREEAILTENARKLLLNAVHTNLINSFELEQTLNLVNNEFFGQFVDVAEIREYLVTVIGQDQKRASIFSISHDENIH